MILHASFNDVCVWTSGAISNNARLSTTFHKHENYTCNFTKTSNRNTWKFVPRTYKTPMYWQVNYISYIWLINLYFGGYYLSPLLLLKIVRQDLHKTWRNALWSNKYCTKRYCYDNLSCYVHITRLYKRIFSLRFDIDNHTYIPWW